MPDRRLLLPALFAVPALALAGCATGEAAADSDRLQVVASTDVYGAIVEAVAGDAVDVTSIIEGATQDPHSYEATARDRLALSRADLVVQNGGGYDPFIAQLLEAEASDIPVVDAVEVSGVAEGTEEEAHAEDEASTEAHAEDEAGTDEAHAEEDDHGHEHIEGVNEHVWYDLHAMEQLAGEISAQLSELDPANADAFEANAAEFTEALGQVHDDLHALEDAAAGREALVTEPVPAYLLADAGLENATPAEFSEALEEGTDVPPLALQQVLDEIGEGHAALLAYNAQTSSPETEQVRAAAEQAGVPVVDFTETLPDGMDYVTWMADNVERLGEALGS